MPRTTRSSKNLGVIASAAKVSGRRVNRGIPVTNGSEPWQAEVWNMLDEVGELEFYREWISNAISRVELYVSEVDAQGNVVRSTNPDALNALGALFGGEAGRSQMMAAFASLLAIPGESWLVGLLEPSDDPDGPDQWRVLSRDEIQDTPGSWIIERGDGIQERLSKGDPDKGKLPDAYVIRIWRPHPRKWVHATSSVRSALPILRELKGLTQHIAANIDSRLAGAGLLVVPSEITWDTPGQNAPADDPEMDPFIASLTQAMITPIADRGDASAVVPMVIKAPGALLDKIKHITFTTPFDERTKELRDEAIRRLANSLDVPAEVLLGMADVNHWTGWLLDENAIKMHVEPLVEVIVGALTTRWLWPILAGGAETVDPSLRRFRIEGDTSALRQRPDLGPVAKELHAAMVITDAALARETGFEDSDILTPGSTEWRQRVLAKIAAAQTSPDVALGALTALGAPVEPIQSSLGTPAPPGGNAPAEIPAAQEPVAIESRRDLPQQQAAAATALLLGSESVVLRAVEKAWNRAGRRGKGARRPIPAEQLDACLDGAWGYLPRIAAMTGVEHTRLHAAVDGYTRNLLATGAEHEPIAFAQMLATRVLTDPPEALGA